MTGGEIGFPAQIRLQNLGVRPVFFISKIIWHFLTFCNKLILWANFRADGPPSSQPACGLAFSKFFGACGGLCFLENLSAPAAGFVCSIVSAPAAGSCFSFVKLSHLMLLPSLSRLGPPRQNKFYFGPLSDPRGVFWDQKERNRRNKTPKSLKIGYKTTKIV